MVTMRTLKHLLYFHSEKSSRLSHKFLFFLKTPIIQSYSMEIFLLIALLLIFLSLSMGIFFMHSKLKSMEKNKPQDENLFMLLQQQIQQLNKTMDEKMGETYRAMNQTQANIHKTIQGQFGQSAKLIGDITEKLSNLDKTNQQVVGFSQQLANLERVLTSQKRRGNLGEAGLQLVLENILPPGAFKMQYQFEDGDTVDAAVFAKEGIIPVDAKFSLENYTRLLDETDETRRAQLERDFKGDLKLRIDETSKYIKPKYGTLEFAFMFIPAEAIYYDLLVNEVGAVKVNTRSLIDYAFNTKKVIIVSPTTFAAYLQTVLQGLRAFQIEEGAKEIRQNVEKLGKHIKSYEDYMLKLGTSMSTTVNHYNSAYKELGKIDKDVVKITDGEKKIEPLEIERPRLRE